MKRTKLYIDMINGDKTQVMKVANKTIEIKARYVFKESGSVIIRLDEVRGRYYSGYNYSLQIWLIREQSVNGIWTVVPLTPRYTNASEIESIAHIFY